MKTTTLQLKNSMNRSHCASALLLMPLALVCFALLPPAQGQLSPPPDGCYSNFTTAEGCNALNSLSTGSGNTALGWEALFSDTDGSFNTGVGSGALIFNNGSSNTAVGAAALLLNTSGAENVAVGTDALAFNDGGNYNTAIGGFALYSNTNGIENTAVGDLALQSNGAGSFNTATGTEALVQNTSGSGNTAIGSAALISNNGDNNTAVGDQALQSNSTGSGNIALGALSGTAVFTGNNNIYIGDEGGGSESNVIAIGNLPPGGFPPYTQFFVGAVFGTTTVSGTTLPVIVSDQGQLGTAPSAARFKKDIKSLDNASESILALRPVKFHYKSDNKGTPQFGLIAEEVAAINPDLVVRDKNGEIYSVRYDAVNAMLLNEFLKEHRTVQEQDATITQLKAELQATATRQQKQIEALTAGLQKVSAQLAAASPSGGGLEASKPAPRLVNNNQ